MALELIKSKSNKRTNFIEGLEFLEKHTAVAGFASNRVRNAGQTVDFMVFFSAIACLSWCVDTLSGVVC
ncbi:hypothetical protein CEK71_11085 [Methylovulum psychrotolerans]|uniref:Uncharacterized protein n=1 Tax=Methylovulum psychrotolerans TaxID=1704499 RepID=A0A1Z4BZ89_9GAMM|nr:hypothetical protein CEK71_11085 [Methylovulum psychrotolerans]